MAIQRTAIETALDEIISNEEGMRFQGLAVVLAKQRWPELIASERHNDLGLDAYVPASLAYDGTGKGLSSSITGTLAKIKTDINKFRQHVQDVKVLLFATPCKVTNQAAEPWKKAVREEFDIELHILSREDIVTELTLPANASICRSHLGLQVAVGTTIEELIEKARTAAGEVVEAWLAHSRLAGKPRIALQAVALDKDGHDTGEILTLEHLQQALLESRRIILEAPAGRGKTTTLIQLAELQRAQAGLAFLVDLPGWVRANQGMLEFIAGMPSFQSRGIDAAALTQAYNTIPCSFLLNGWNEVTDEHSDGAVHALAELERNYPKAGIIVATRTHYIPPPLRGSFRARLLPLNRQQRAVYLHEALAGQADELIHQLERDRTLDDLTRTPLILAEVATIFRSGAPIPKTRASVLDAMTRLIEEAAEHQSHLAGPPLRGHSQDYLVELAVQMTSQGAVTLEEAEARRVTTLASDRLRAAGQVATQPEPSEILNVLCAHHVLERLEHPSVAFRFEHQQFQERYVSLLLRKQLLELAENSDSNRHRDFVRAYVNIPCWEEPLRMVAEEIGALEAHSPDVARLLKAGKMLVEGALSVDPVFAAELARLCGNTVWLEVREAVGERLRSWYQVGDDAHRQCALAGIFASGSEDFLDILLPLITNDDQQVRLKTYRSSSDFHVSSLGENWRQIVRGWAEDHRADFISEVVREHHTIDIAEDFTRTDPSAKVRAAALRELEWVGAVGVLSRVLASYDDRAFEEVLRERVLHDIPPGVRPRALEAYGTILRKVEGARERLRIWLTIEKLGGGHALEGIKAELSQWPSGKIGDGDDLLIKSALEVVRRSDMAWVSHWVATRIVEGSLWSDHWITFVSYIPEVFRQDLIKKLDSENLEYKNSSAVVSVLAAIADAEIAGYVFARLCSHRTETLSSTEKPTEAQWAVIRQLQALFQAIPPNIAVAGMLARLSPEVNALEYKVAVEIVGRIGDEASDLRSQLPADLRQALRRYFKNGMQVALIEDDFNGTVKAESAMALARVGDPEDIAELERLIRADIERLRRGREARLSGDRGPLGNGAAMSYSNWHVRAVACLDAQNGERVLLELLREPDYERDAVGALIRLARVQEPEQRFGFNRPDYRTVWETRSRQQVVGFDEDRRVRYISSIKQHISTLTEQRLQSGTPDSFNGRLKTLAGALAILDARKSAALVMEVMALPGQWDGYTRADALEALLFGGAHLEANAVLKVLDPTIDHIIQKTGAVHDQNNGFLLQRCLCLLSFLQPPSVGVARIRQIIAAARIPSHDLRDVVTALGNSRCDDALDLLLELAATHRAGMHHITGEWISAVAALDTPRSRRVLLSYVDPDIEPFKGEMNLEYHHREQLASCIAHMARTEPAIKNRLYQLCIKQRSPTVRGVLASVAALLGTSEAVSAGLNLIHDQTNPAVPHELSRSLEGIFLGKRPYGSGEYAYTIEPISANEIRSRLFEMISEEGRKRSAWGLLGQIESWRLQYGRPNNEPRHPAFDSGKSWPLLAENPQMAQAVPTG